MPFRAQYLADVGLTANPYPLAPADRIREVYRTTRRGNISHALAIHLWNAHLQPIYAALARVPAMQAGYDNWFVQTALAIETTLAAEARDGFGAAQKILNLFMKDMWAFRLTPPAVEPLLHAPIDRGILSKLRQIPATWNPWTEAVAGAAATATVTDYLGIQQAYRAFLAAPAGPGVHLPVFGTVIDMEQFIWHRI
jgi:hypothetical protein